MTASDTEFVFVYGTLRRGACNAFLMDGATYVRAGRVRGRLHRLDGYPALLPDPASAEWVVGDLWEVSPEHLAAMDAYEAEAAEGDGRAGFRRVPVEVFREEPEPERWPATGAWTWRWTGTMEGLRKVPSGDWMDEEFPPKPGIFTSLGCLSLIAVPVGTAAILNMVVHLVGPGFGVAIAIAGALLLAIGTPAVALVLSRWAERRREGGVAIRGLTEALAWIWAFVAGLVLLIALAEWLIG